MLQILELNEHLWGVLENRPKPEGLAVKAHAGAEIPEGVRIATRAGKLLTVSGVCGQRRAGDKDQAPPPKVPLPVRQ